MTEVRVGAAGAHLGGDPDRLHDLPLSGALAQCDPGVAADAWVTCATATADRLLNAWKASWVRVRAALAAKPVPR
jgi:hypothetical protein